MFSPEIPPPAPPAPLPPPVPPSPERDGETMKLVRHFFKMMCAEENTPPEEAVHYLPEYFLHWVRGKLPALDREAVLAAVPAKPVAWAFLTEMAEGLGGALQLLPLWPMVTLAHRGDPRHKVRRVHSVLLVTWEDGRVFPLSINLDAELLVGGALNDAFVAAQLHQHYKGVRAQIAEEGLDALHDKHGKDMGGDYPFEVLMGAFLKIIPQLKPELHEHLKGYLRLAQAIIAPPIPPQARAAIDRVRAAAGLPASQPRLQGGFDE